MLGITYARSHTALPPCPLWVVSGPSEYYQLNDRFRVPDTHASDTFLVIIHDCSASRPDIGFIRLAPHNLSGVVYHKTERIGNYLYIGKQ
jgi:hypothetical protein